MSHIDTESPEFTVAIRGYDKVQVDDYVERLLAFASEAEERARSAESELEFSRHATVGPRVSEILDLAVAEAKELRERASTECERLRSETEAECEELVARARESEAELKTRSEREAEQARVEIEAERRRAELVIEQLRETKEALVADLRQIHATLARAAGLSETEAEELALEEEPTIEAPSLAPPLPKRGSEAA